MDLGHNSRHIGQGDSSDSASCSSGRGRSSSGGQSCSGMFWSSSGGVQSSNGLRSSYPMNLSRSRSATRTSMSRRSEAMCKISLFCLVMLSVHWPRDSSPLGPEGLGGAVNWSSFDDICPVSRKNVKAGFEQVSEVIREGVKSWFWGRILEHCSPPLLSLVHSTPPTFLLMQGQGVVAWTVL